MSKKIKTRYICKSCNEIIFMTKDDISLINEGYTNAPNQCDECSIDDGYSDEMIQEFSDADSGL